MKKTPLIIAFLITTAIIACDEGNIEPESFQEQKAGQSIHLSGCLTGIDSWGDKYEVAVASFGAPTSSSTGNYSIAQRSITSSTLDENGNFEITLNNVASPAITVELCVTNKIRQRVVTFASINLSDHSREEVIEWNVGSVDVGLFTAIQDKVFNPFCIACHGSGGLAAGLNLQAGASYSQLVRTASTTTDGMMRVRPGRTSQSVLYQVLNGRSSAKLNNIHGNIIQNAQDVSSATLTTLVNDWIADGAKP